MPRNFINNQESITVLRRLALLDFCGREFPSFEQILEFLKENRLRIGVRQLHRDLRELSKTFRVKRRLAWGGSPRWSYWYEDDWAARLHCAGQACVAHELADMKESTIRIPVTTDREEAESLSATEKMIRIMLMVEKLPSEDDDPGLDSGKLKEYLKSHGIDVSRRTVQRDLEFVREHFLVIQERGRGRQHLWRRVVVGDWMDNFEPRYPRMDFSRNEVVHRFLYGPFREGGISSDADESASERVLH